MGNLQFKRGLKANLPSSAAVGTPLWCTDTNELYIGTGSSVEKVGSSSGSSGGSSSSTAITYDATNHTLIFEENNYSADTYNKTEIDSILGNIETLLQEI